MANNERNNELLRIVAENPDLPIVAMVDSDIVCEDYGRWLASLGKAYVGEYAVYNEKCYDDRESFTEDYYCCNDTELEEKFNYNPCITDFAVKCGRYTEVQFSANIEAEKVLNKYLGEIAEKYFQKAIIVNVDLPDIDLVKGGE